MKFLHIKTDYFSIDGENYQEFGEKYQLHGKDYRGDNIGFYNYNNISDKGAELNATLQDNSQA